MKIGIVGLGYVGLTLAIAAAARGAEVFGTEINPKIKSCLEENRAHFFEPGLDELIAKHNHKNFHCINGFNAPPIYIYRIYNHGWDAASPQLNQAESRRDKQSD